MAQSHSDPLPGDFDQELWNIAAADVHVEEASRERRLVVQSTLDGDDAAAHRRETSSK
jgi:hypothetical protein